MAPAIAQLVNTGIQLQIIASNVVARQKAFAELLQPAANTIGIVDLVLLAEITVLVEKQQLLRPNAHVLININGQIMHASNQLAQEHNTSSMESVRIAQLKMLFWLLKSLWVMEAYVFV